MCVCVCVCVQGHTYPNRHECQSIYTHSHVSALWVVLSGDIVALHGRDANTKRTSHVQHNTSSTLLIQGAIFLNACRNKRQSTGTSMPTFSEHTLPQIVIFFATWKHFLTGKCTEPRLTQHAISAVRSLSINTTKGKRRSLLTSWRSVTFIHIHSLSGVVWRIRRPKETSNSARHDLSNQLILLTSPKTTRLAQHSSDVLFS